MPQAAVEMDLKHEVCPHVASLFGRKNYYTHPKLVQDIIVFNYMEI